MSLKPKFLALSIAVFLLQAVSHFVAAESLGNLAQYPPERILLTVTTADNGSPELDPEKTHFKFRSVLPSHRLTALTCGMTSQAGESKCPSF